MSKRKQGTRPLINPPSTIPETLVTALVPIPDSADFRRILIGGLRILSAWTNYQLTGDTKGVDTANAWKEAIDMVTFKTFCEQMIECLDDPDVLEALYNAMLGLGFSPSGASGTNTGTANGGITGSEIFDNCNTEDLYGACLKIVEALDRLTNDILEFIEIFTNFLEAQKKVLQTIPVIGLLGEPASWIDWAFEVMTEIYNAVYTQTVQEAIACEIYCLAVTECIITPQIIRQAYVNFVDAEITLQIDGSLQDFIDSVLEIPLTVDAFWVAVLHSTWMEIFARGGEINGLTWRYIELALDTYVPATPICEDCETWCYEVLLNSNSFSAYLDHNLSPVDRGLSYSSGNGYVGTYWSGFTNEYHQINAFINIGTGTANITRIEVEFNISAGENTANANNQLGIEDSSGETTGDTTHGSYTGGVMVWQGDTTISPTNRPYIQLSIASSDTGAIDPDGTGLWYRIKMQGAGTNPFGESNCS